MIYFDDIETIDDMMEALDKWLPKVKKGGIVAGYDPARFGTAPSAFIVISNYCEVNDIVPESSKFNPNVYWFTK